MSADDFYLRATSGIAIFSAIELIHPDFTLRFQNWDDEQAIVLDGLIYQYGQFNIGFSNVSTDLEQQITVNFFEQVDILKTAFKSASHLQPVEFNWLRFRSDDYDTPLDARYGLYIKQPSYNTTGLSFIASAEGLNDVSTGEIYTLELYPLLKGMVN